MTQWAVYDVWCFWVPFRCCQSFKNFFERRSGLMHGFFPLVCQCTIRMKIFSVINQSHSEPFATAEGACEQDDLTLPRAARPIRWTCCQPSPHIATNNQTLCWSICSYCWWALEEYWNFWTVRMFHFVVCSLFVFNLHGWADWQLIFVSDLISFCVIVICLLSLFG